MTVTKPELAVGSLTRFVNTSIDNGLIEEDGRTEPEALKERVLELLNYSILNIPAYATAVKALNVPTIQTWSDFKESMPFLDKKNFINVYPLNERCVNGDMSRFDFLHVSSGSGGVPTLWGRFSNDELVIAARFEQIMHDSFLCHKRKTLAMICFPLGTWVGGLFTTVCMRYLAMKGYPITLVCPGNDVAEILRVSKMLCPMFEQTVVLGYPPFCKTFIDAGRGQGIPWQSYNLKMVFAGEVFSEEWRNLVATRAGIKSPKSDIHSIYGTADAGVLACESVLSTHIRGWLASNPAIAKELFQRDRLPSLMQYDPFCRFMEMTHENTIAFTTVPPKASTEEGGLEAVIAPLIRYSIGDSGNIMSFDDMIKFCMDRGFDALRAVGSMSADLQTIRKLPFVWVFGRAFWTVSLYGANVYVDNVMVGLEQSSVSDHVTGKFVLYVAKDANEDSILAVIVELAPKAVDSDTLKSAIAASIRDELIKLNSEYGHYVPKEYQLPMVTLLPYGDPTRFKIGVKHQYIQDDLMK
ncbi:hypothetical protein SmJEL517_g00292 [Synchytrium microbalum]|uniref:Phenylacetate-CoA ligase n=1 Tax=Synchytrium microbalum TaxID=1806994 RepID=A0A507CIR9_9FUNG|nr:uncharacterized protein SmJEL517_g00292 [Synchytrium microbalum]TPX38054.1 hypothetical protein SmJEL517_g00292 [Synchytrium microbalum]